MFTFLFITLVVSIAMFAWDTSAPIHYTEADAHPMPDGSVSYYNNMLYFQNFVGSYRLVISIVLFVFTGVLALLLRNSNWGAKQLKL